MRGRNWKVVVPIIIIILVVIGVVVYANRKSKNLNVGAKVTEAPAEQKTELPSISPEMEESELPTADQETIEATVTPTPTRRVYHITNPPTEKPTPVPPTVTPNPWKETEYPPTCEEAGYVVRENTVEGYTVIDGGKPALGHEYGKWKQDTETGMYITTCTRCGKEIERKELYEGILPRIDLTGSMEGISKSDRVTLQFDFASPTESFSCYSYTTLQGHTTLEYPKKNYTIRLYDDEEITQKHKVVFNDWQREHKYVLKANYRDVSQARNLIAANLWADMAACRPNLHETLKHTSNYGAVDGFPVVVFLNEEFHGLYTMNLHIDDDLYQMKNAYDAVMITNSTEPDECHFLAEASFTDQKKAWEVEFCGTGDDDQWAKDKLNELIRFVMTSDDKAFKEHLKDYLDVDSAIDYLIFLYVTGLQSNGTKDLVLLKYQDCDVWIPSVYDMEGAFGLNLAEMKFESDEIFLPQNSDGTWVSETYSKLWDRLLQAFFPEIVDRYSELRKKVINVDNLSVLVNSFLNKGQEDYYEFDLTKYPRILNLNVREQITQYIYQRIQYLDYIFNGK